MDILLIDEKLKEKLRITPEQKLNVIKKIKELEKVLEYLTFDKYISLCEKQLFENRKILKKMEEEEDFKFYLLDTSLIIKKYKKILSKPILRSNKSNQKSDIINEYLQITQKYYEYSFLTPNIDQILYHDYNNPPQRQQCKDCNGIDFLEESCKDCGRMISRIDFISSHSRDQNGKSNPKKKEKTINKDGY